MTGKYCNRKLIKLMQTEIISNVYFVPVWAKHDAIISSFDSDLLEKTVFCVYVIDVLLFHAEMGEGLCSTHPNLLPAIISINIFFFSFNLELCSISFLFFLIECTFMILSGWKIEIIISRVTAYSNVAFHFVYSLHMFLVLTNEHAL